MALTDQPSPEKRAYIFIFYLIPGLKKPSHQINSIGCDPGDHALTDHNSHCPFCAKFTFDSSNSSYTWRIKKTKYKKTHCCKKMCIRDRISIPQTASTVRVFDPS